MSLEDENKQDIFTEEKIDEDTFKITLVTDELLYRHRFERLGKKLIRRVDPEGVTISLEGSQKEIDEAKRVLLDNLIKIPDYLKNLNITKRGGSF